MENVDYLRERREQAKTLGQCQWCLADAGGKSLCESCAAKRAASYRASMEARPKAVRATAREKMIAVRDALADRLSRLPTAREIAEEYGCHPTRVRQVLDAGEFSAGPKKWARVPRDAWRQTLDRLRRLEKVLAKHGVTDAVELDRKLSGGSQ